MKSIIMSCSMLFFSVSTLIFGIESGPASPDALMEMEEKVITATRTERKITDVSRAVNLINKETIASRLPRNSAEAIREETGIAVQKTEHGGGNAIIRGLGSSQVLLLVDGIRLNNSTYRSGHHPYLTTVDEQMLERIEIVRGPGSSLYGSDAMGGTINLITKTPRLGKKEWTAHGRVTARYASADEERILRAESALEGQRIGLTAGASLRASEDLKRGGSKDQPGLEISPITQAPTGYQGNDYDAKLSVRPAPGHLLTLAWQGTRRPEIPRYDKYVNYGTSSKDKFFRWVYTDQNRDLAYLNYGHTGEAESDLSVRGFLAFHRQEEGRESQATATSTTNREWGETRSLGFGAQGSYQMASQTFTLGADGYLDAIQSTASSVDTSGSVTEKLLALYPDGARYNTWGAFLQDELKSGSWSFTAGMRYSLTQMEFTVPQDPSLPLNIGRIQKDFQALTGNLSVSWMLDKGVSLSSNVSQGYRAPNLSDVARTGESKTSTTGNTYEIPNPELEPTSMIAGDLGLKVVRERLRSSLFIYQSEIWDILGTAPANRNGMTQLQSGPLVYGLVSKQNLGEATIKGVEADLSLPIHAKLWFHSALTYTSGWNSTLDEPVSGIPPVSGQVGILWDNPNKGLNLYLRFALSQDQLSKDDQSDARITPGGTPGWYTFSLKGQWRVHSNLMVRTGVENFLDYNYREHGSGINGPGRNVLVGLDLSL